MIKSNKEYINLKFENYMNDNNVKFNIDIVISFDPEDCRDHPSIFQDHIYYDLIENLKDSSKCFIKYFIKYLNSKC